MDDLQPAQILTDDAPNDTQDKNDNKAAEEPVVEKTLVESPEETTTIQEAREAGVPQVVEDKPRAISGGSDYKYDQELASAKIETKRKTFFIDLKANDMGRYIKISERSSNKRSTIIVPEENIVELITKIQGLIN